MQLKLILALASAAALLALVGGAYWKGRMDGYEKKEAEYTKEEAEGLENRTEIERIIVRMPKNEVQRLLEDKWCRDCQ